MNVFKKLAIIEPPPAMLVDISNFCIGAYAHKLLTLLREQRPNFKSSFFGLSPKDIEKQIETLGQFFLTYVKKMGSKSISPGANQVSYRAPLNFDGWKCPFGDAKQIEEMLKSRGFDSITCRLHFNGSDEFSGLWDGANKTLEVHIKIPFLKILDDFWEVGQSFPEQEAQLFETVEHELIHLVQLVGFYARNTKDIIGLPSPNVRNNKQPYLVMPGQKRVEESVPHALDDSEFYTDLMDSINLFTRMVTYISPKLRVKYLRAFIGADNVDPKTFPLDTRDMITINPFFAALKEGNHAKWKLAVKRFTNYIQEHPNILLA